MDRGIQTFNFAPKSKDIQVNPAKKEESGCQATEWDIYDSFSGKSISEEYNINLNNINFNLVIYIQHQIVIM